MNLGEKASLVVATGLVIWLIVEIITYKVNEAFAKKEDEKETHECLGTCGRKED